MDFITHWLKSREPEVVGLQKVKVSDADFPHATSGLSAITPSSTARRAGTAWRCLAACRPRRTRAGCPAAEDDGARLLRVRLRGQARLAEDGARLLRVRVAGLDLAEVLPGTATPRRDRACPGGRRRCGPPPARRLAGRTHPHFREPPRRVEIELALVDRRCGPPPARRPAGRTHRGPLVRYPRPPRVEPPTSSACKMRRLVRLARVPDEIDRAAALDGTAPQAGDHLVQGGEAPGGPLVGAAGRLRHPPKRSRWPRPSTRSARRRCRRRRATAGTAGSGERGGDRPLARRSRCGQRSSRRCGCSRLFRLNRPPPALEVLGDEIPLQGFSALKANGSALNDRSVVLRMCASIRIKAVGTQEPRA